MARIKAPAARGMTVEDLWDKRREVLTVWITIGVSIIAAIVSFQALLWVGTENGGGWAAPLVPLAVDGGALVFMLVIVDGESKGRPFRKRALAWLGLFAVLGVSVYGNIYHAVHLGTGLLPFPLLVAMAAVPPVLVALLVHLLGTTLRGGINAHVLVSDRETVHFGLTRVADYDQGPAQGPAQVAARAPRTAIAQAPRTAVAQKPGKEKVGKSDPLKDAARILFDEAVRADPSRKPDAAAIHAAIESPKDVATTRRWVQKWWEDFDGELAGRPDPILEQVATTPSSEQVARSA